MQSSAVTAMPQRKRRAREKTAKQVDNWCMGEYGRGKVKKASP
jgi:hypothetical protein